MSNSPVDDLNSDIEKRRQDQRCIENEIFQESQQRLSDEAFEYPTDQEQKRGIRLKNDSLETDIHMKRNYGYWLLGIMAIQLFIMNRVFLDVGIGSLVYDNYVLHLYITGTLLELFGLVLLITKYLFRS